MGKYPRKRLTAEIFAQKAKKIHKNKYDYSLVEYKSSKTKVKIICPQHGIYEQIPYDHVRGFGCAKCSGVKKLSTKEFIERSKLAHGERFDYSLSQYKNKETKVKIICSVHGVFEQRAQHHMNGISCPACSKKKRKTTQFFIEEAKKVHGDKYDYSKTLYKNTKTPLKIICQEHGEVLVDPCSHLKGGQCPECNTPIGEALIKQFLIENDIKFEQQKRFEDCVFKKHLLFDFFLPDHNTIIEFDGEQHFKPIKYYGGEKTFKVIQKRDKVKNQYCINNKIKLIRIPYFKQKYIQNILNEQLIFF